VTEFVSNFEAVYIARYFASVVSALGNVNFVRGVEFEHPVLEELKDRNQGICGFSFHFALSLHDLLFLCSRSIL
jgi:hypothetical protein